MRNSSSNTESKRSMRMLILFCSLVFLLVAGSLLLKLFVLIKESRFDTGDMYTIGFVHQNEVDVIGLNPETRAMSHLKVRGKIDQKMVFKDLGVFPDTVFKLEKEFSGPNKVSSLVSDAFFHKGGVSSELSSYDLVRLYFFSKGISSSDVSTEEVMLPVLSSDLDTLARELFSDQKAVKDDVSVSINNGAGIEGLGKRLERSLLNKGFNVISVNNAESIESKSSVVYTGKLGYSVKKLEDLLQITATNREKVGLSDIVITLGRDQVDQERY